MDATDFFCPVSKTRPPKCFMLKFEFDQERGKLTLIVPPDIFNALKEELREYGVPDLVSIGSTEVYWFEDENGIGLKAPVAPWTREMEEVLRIVSYKAKKE